MAENSRPSERIHLFSVAGSLRTLSAMVGALIAGLVPLMFIDQLGKVDAYRFATYGGLALWFLSLIPALMLRSSEAVERPEQSGERTSSGRSLRNLFADIKHPRRIKYFVLTSGLIALGSAGAVPLLNIVFHEGEIGVLFGLGELTLAASTLLVPLLAARMIKVDAIAVTRIASLPFILGLGLLPLSMGEGGTLLFAMGIAYVGRTGVFRMSFPLDDAFNMEVLEPRERATSTGMEIAVGGAVSAVAIIVGSRFMDAGDFTTPFMIMAAVYLASTTVYWRVFRPLELSEIERRSAADGPEEQPIKVAVDD